jgi:hypothetical protein
MRFFYLKQVVIPVDGHELILTAIKTNSQLPQNAFDSHSV